LSDFLAILVDRLLDPGPILQRRRPALFEPVPDATLTAPRGFGTEPILTEEQTVVERDSSAARVESPTINARPLRPPPSPSSEELAPSQERSRQKPRHRAPDIESSPQSTRQNVHGETSVAVPVIEPQVRLITLQPSQSSMPQRVGNLEEVIAGPPRRIDTIVERRIEREVINERMKAAPTFDQAPMVVRPSPNGSRQSAGAHEGESPRLPLKATSEVKPRQQEGTIRPLTHKKPTPPRVSAPVMRVPRPEPARTPSQAPPSIQVTIGRVEVRATHQTTSRPQAGRSAGPKLSLEAYLRSRAEGN
jgi:hypothetical protein